MEILGIARLNLVENNLVTLQDARSVYFCTKGVRLFFKKYNLDYMEFLNNGIDAQELINTGDSMALQVVEAANGRRK